MRHQALHFIDPVQLARINNLELMARTVVEGFLIGLHRSPHSGSSIEFAQYRPYAQGDDPRFIDWKLFGRTDRLHVKQFHEETNLRCMLLLDCSASMDYGSEEITKFEYGRMLVACLAKILSTQKDAFGLIAYHDQLIHHIPPRADPNHLRRILAELQGTEPSRSTDTAGTLRFLGSVVQPRGMIVLVSDLLHPVEETMEHLRSLRARRHDILVLHISDPAEQTFPFERSTTFIDPEDDSELFAIPTEVRDQYLENRSRHFDTIRHECLAAEIEIHEFSTDEPLDRALTQFLRHRNNALMTSSLKQSRTRRAGR